MALDLFFLSVPAVGATGSLSKGTVTLEYCGICRKLFQYLLVPREREAGLVDLIQGMMLLMLVMRWHVACAVPI